MEQLLAPVSDALPCGEDLDESVDFDTLRAAFDDNFPIDSGVSRLADGEPGPPPVDWRELFEKIEDLCGQTKDLWLAVSYARCGFTRSDPDIVAQGLEFTARLLEEQWGDVHPVIDDPNGRVRAPIFEDIARRGAFAMPFLELPLVMGSRSSLRAGQILDAHENGGSSDHFVEVRMTLDQLDDESKQAVAAQMRAMLDCIARIEAVLREKNAGSVPDFSTVRDTIEMVEDAYLTLAGLKSEGGEEDAGAGEDAAVDAVMAGGGGAGGPAFGGAVKSRDDVIRALGAIEQYYTRAEPGHPMRLAMGRLRSWVNKDFMEILEDIAPRSLDEVKSVLLERRDVE
ncbi:MAG: type VI secretion system ImpA family N-terminal domain-containing protein [Porphyrobacter sp.]|nr:type VI secretion system ImpA family N-terminal domain-containing protein [Porphyrobacter sp.]